MRLNVVSTGYVKTVTAALGFKNRIVCYPARGLSVPAHVRVSVQGHSCIQIYRFHELRAPAQSLLHSFDTQGQSNLYSQAEIDTLDCLCFYMGLNMLVRAVCSVQDQVTPPASSLQETNLECNL